MAKAISLVAALTAIPTTVAIALARPAKPTSSRPASSVATAPAHSAGAAITGPLIIAHKSRVVIVGLRVTSTTGDCLQIRDSSYITVERSQIGPCGGNGIAISHSSHINVYDSYLHPETLSHDCCDQHDGILARDTAHLRIEGNVIAYGETNIEALAGVEELLVAGNFLLNPRGPFPRGQNIQAWNGHDYDIEANYALSSGTTGKYKYPDHQEDSINVGKSHNIRLRHNYITGGHSPSGCGIAVDQGADRSEISANVLVNTGQCGIGIASGVNHLVDGNRIINTTPVKGGGNTALYVWNQYPHYRCGAVIISNNVATEMRSNGTQSGYWDGGGCGAVIKLNNIWDDPAFMLLTPPTRKLPPPAIPPGPVKCVARSPYSTHERLHSCE